MRAKLENGQITISLAVILENLTPDEKLYFVEALSCETEIIEHVAAQIVTGWTENGWHGGKSFGHTPFTALDKARRLLAESASAIAKKEIADLVSLNKRTEESLHRAWQENRGLSDELSKLRY